MAESFGTDADRYDRARPRYPDALIKRIIATSRGPDAPDMPDDRRDVLDVLDVGCGTGIAARQFQAAGCRVLGVDVDARMAEFARAHGVDAEVGAFESWDPAGRTFDAIVSGQTWHWIEPVAGAAAAARVVRPGGRFAAFWNVFRPAADVAEVFSAVHRRILPDAPLNPWAVPPLDAYGSILDKAADGIRATGAFAEPEEWRFDWERAYTRDEWLDQLPTNGLAGVLPPDRLAAIITATGRAIDAMGGGFAMGYTAAAVTARRTAALT
ncbi:class I SAM-dependent methyltransferase [Streptomyces sp. NPDC002851]